MIKLELKQNGFGERIFVGHGEKEDFKCSQCLREIIEGFMCENNCELVLCSECQSEFKMSKCKHKSNEHHHIKFIKSNA